MANRDGREVIANFMDYSVTEIGKEKYFTNHDTGEVLPLDAILKSMDQIMKVFKKIRTLGWRVVIDDDKCRISKDGKTFKAHTIVTINSCYLCILYFIDYTNKLREI